MARIRLYRSRFLQANSKYSSCLIVWDLQDLQLVALFQIENFRQIENMFAKNSSHRNKSNCSVKFCLWHRRSKCAIVWLKVGLKLADSSTNFSKFSNLLLWFYFLFLTYTKCIIPDIIWDVLNNSSLIIHHMLMKGI